MGMNTKIMLPDNVRVADVARIIGICAGKIPVKTFFPDGKGWSTSVPGVMIRSFDTSPLYDVAKILIAGPFSLHVTDLRVTDLWGQDSIYVMYHFEPHTGGRLLMPRSTSFWVAVGRRLVKFYGGKIDYNDCDDCEVDFSRRTKSRNENAPTDGDAWYRFQERLLKMKPLTLEELQTA